MNNMSEETLNNALEKGEVIGFVTDTVWGIGALPTSKKGVDKIYEIKNRDRSKPLILMSNDIKNLLPYVEKLPTKAVDLINKYFPGALTIIVKKSDLTPDYITNCMETVGIRVPQNDEFRQICEVVKGHVLATTSANISNEKTSVSRADVENSVGDKLFKIFGEDTSCDGIASTIISVSEDNTVKILRQGSVYLEDSI